MRNGQSFPEGALRASLSRSVATCLPTGHRLCRLGVCVCVLLMY
jgi:hypothetical protein